MNRLRNPILHFACVAVLLTFLGRPQSAAGCIVADIVYQGAFDQIIFDGGGFVPTPFEVYHVVIHNFTSHDLFTLEGVTLEGPWLQASPVPIFSQMGTALPPDPFDAVVPPVGDNFVPDTFFSYPGVVTPFADTPVDTTSELGAVTVAALGAPWVAAGATETIAVLSVPQGTSLGLTRKRLQRNRSAGFIVDGEIVPFCIPEPGTVMLASSCVIVGLIGCRRVVRKRA